MKTTRLILAAALVAFAAACSADVTAPAVPAATGPSADVSATPATTESSSGTSLSEPETPREGDGGLIGSSGGGR
jgi:hypothetical protein